jgi:hypothetical protein
MNGGDYIMFSFMICTTHQIIWVIKERKMRLGGRRERKTGFWWENLRKTNHLEDLSVDGRIILKGILNK